MIPQVEFQETRVPPQPHGLNQSGRMRWLAEHATPNGPTATNWPVVANTLGIDTSRIRLYLAGTRRITKRDAAAIADYFNVDLNWLRLDDPGSYHRLNHTNGVYFDNTPEATMADAKTQGKKLEMAKRQYEERIGYVKSWNQYSVELGINNSLISLYRRCIRRISKPHAQLLAKVFDVSAEWLRNTDEQMFPRIGNQARPEILTVASAGDSQRERLQHAKRAVEQRESRRLSWSQFAKFVGMSHASLSHNVSGTRRISDAWAAKISAATGISPVWLQTGEGTPIAAVVTRFNPTVMGPGHERFEIAKRLFEETIKKTLTWDEIAQLCSNSKQTSSQVTTDLMLQPSSGQIDGRIAFSIGNALGVNWIWLATGAGNPTDTNYQLSRTAQLTQRWRLELAKDTYERESATAITWESIADRAMVGADHMEKLLGETKKLFYRTAFNIALVLRVDHASDSAACEIGTLFGISPSWLFTGEGSILASSDTKFPEFATLSEKLEMAKQRLELRSRRLVPWAEISNMVGISCQYLQYLNRSPAPMARSVHLEKIANILEVNPSWLVNGSYSEAIIK